jgi:hypothetical protein
MHNWDVKTCFGLAERPIPHMAEDSHPDIGQFEPGYPRVVRAQEEGVGFIVNYAASLMQIPMVFIGINMIGLLLNWLLGPVTGLQVLGLSGPTLCQEHSWFGKAG